MNRLSISQIIASLAMLFLATGSALLMGAPLWAIVLPVLAGISVLLITAQGTAAAATPTSSPEKPSDVTDHPDFASLMEAITDPLMLIEKGRIIHANRAAQRLLGAHIQGEDARIAIRHPAAAERLASLVPMSEAIMLDMVGLGTRDQRWQMRIAPLGSESEIRRLVHLADHSGAYAAEKMRVDFVANASHELRTPLAGILGFIETLGDPDLGRDNDTRQRFLKIMDGEALHDLASVGLDLALGRGFSHQPWRTRSGGRTGHHAWPAGSRWGQAATVAVAAQPDWQFCQIWKGRNTDSRQPGRGTGRTG